MTQPLQSAQKSPETLEYLLNRRSIKASHMREPGPDAAELESLLSAAARVPDHGMLCPWYFIVLQGEQRAAAGDILAKAYRKDHPDARPDKVQIEAERFTRAPLVIAVVSRIKQGKPPVWEQALSAGAACMNMVHAANVSGFAAQWITEWYSYHPDVKAAFGLDERDHFAGFIYIGTPTIPPEERERPNLDEIVTHWHPGATLNKGDIYNRTKFPLPEAGFQWGSA